MKPGELFTCADIARELSVPERIDVITHVEELGHSPLFEAPGKSRSTDVSKKFAFILRHKAAEFNVDVRTDGYATVSQVVRT